MDHEDEEEVLAIDEGSGEDARFDNIVGKLQEVLMDPEFKSTLDKFALENCDHFEEDDENKLIYTTLFQEYCAKIEKYIDTRLSEELEDFSMDEFLEMLDKREDEIAGEVFDMLLSFGNFDEFKGLMLSYKRSPQSSLKVQGDAMQVIEAS